MGHAAIVNHLWQSTVFGLAAAGTAWALRRHQARLRFCLWMAASLKFLVPFALLARWMPSLAGGAVAAPAAALSAVRPLAAVVVLEVASPVAPTGDHFSWWYVLAVAWALGALALGLRWAWRWREAAHAAAGGNAEPGVFGLIRQRVLLPDGMALRLTPAELAAVLEHERCHLRRHDNLWSALHMLVETVFWFHPLVWIVGDRLVCERERACDEAVLAAGCEREIYAAAMIAVCREYLPSRLACAAGMSGGGLTRRVRQVLAGGRSRRLTRPQWFVLAALGVVLVGGPVLVLTAQQAERPPAGRFEAATIKPSVPISAGRTIMEVRVDPGRFTAHARTLQTLLMQAYQLKAYQVSGPNWIYKRRYDVDAVTAAPAAPDAMMAMLGNLLTRRFQLQYHRESKVMPVYELEVAAGGSKLKRPGPGGVIAPFRVPQFNGRAIMPGEVATMYRYGRGVELVGYTGTAGLALALSRHLDRPVQDATGLSGNFDIELTSAPFPDEEGMMVRPASAKREYSADAVAPAPSVFTALEQQLGLKLVRTKVPVEILVVDRGTRLPGGGQ